MAERIVHLDWTGAAGGLRALGDSRLKSSAQGLRLVIDGAGPARLIAPTPRDLTLAETPMLPPVDVVVPPVALLQPDETTPPRHALMADGQLRSLAGMFEGLPCFAPGTWIATPDGARPVETLRPGDGVLTRDNGVRPILWRGDSLFDPAAFGNLPQLAPVEVLPDGLGPGQPEQPLVLSPNHRVLVAENASALHFDEREVLVAGRDLPALRRARRLHSGPIRWQHLLLETHEIILAQGAWCESLQPLPERISGLAPRAGAEVRAVLEQAGARDYDAARLMLTRPEAALLAVEI